MTRLSGVIAPFVFAALIGACSDPNALGDAGQANVVDTSVTLWSLRSGPLNQPSAYAMDIRRGVVIWSGGTGFDFAYSTDTLGRSLALPLQVLGLAASTSVNPGLKLSATPFDQLTLADRNGYITNDTIVLAEGQTYFLRSSASACPALGVPIYGKMEILDIDTAAGTLTFRALSDRNCGFRGLAEGIPKS